MNVMDLIALCILLTCVFACYRQGLMMSIFRFISIIASLFLSYLLYPTVGRMLRATPLYSMFENVVINALKIDSGANVWAMPEFSEAIKSFPIPDFLKTALAGNNNPEIYKLFGASTTSEYIAGFCASLMLNALALLIVFTLISVILSVVSALLSITTKLPVIKQFDKLGGLAVGFLVGGVVIFLTYSVFSVLLSLNPDIGKEFSGLINGSLTAELFYGKANIILQSLLKSISSI